MNADRVCFGANSGDMESAPRHVTVPAYYNRAEALSFALITGTLSLTPITKCVQYSPRVQSNTPHVWSAY